MSYYKDRDKLTKELGEDFLITEVGSCVDYLDGSLLKAVERLRSYCSELIRGERETNVQKLVKIKEGLDLLEEIIVVELSKYRSENAADLEKWENIKQKRGENTRVMF